jgi:hypothetical protein
MVQKDLKKLFEKFMSGEEVCIQMEDLLSFTVMVRVNIGVSKYTTLQNGDFLEVKLVPGFCRCTRKAEGK